jgi:His-Xaa-Ser system protein HxsD
MAMPRSKTAAGTIVLRLNPKVYPLDVVYSAAYVFLDRAYILLDGDPKKQILVKLTSKKQGDPKVLAGEFQNELINYADYFQRAAQTRKIREVLLQRAMLTNDRLPLSSIEDIDEGFDDPQGIAIPWEEKYGKKKNTPKP